MTLYAFWTYSESFRLFVSIPNRTIWNHALYNFTCIYRLLIPNLLEPFVLLVIVENIVKQFNYLRFESRTVWKCLEFLQSRKVCQRGSIFYGCLGTTNPGWGRRGGFQGFPGGGGHQGPGGHAPPPPPPQEGGIQCWGEESNNWIYARHFL